MGSRLQRNGVEHDRERLAEFIRGVRDRLLVVPSSTDENKTVLFTMHPRPSRTHWLTIGRRPSWNVVAVRCCRPCAFTQFDIPFEWHVVGRLAAFSTVGSIFTNHPSWPAREAHDIMNPTIAVFCSAESLIEATSHMSPARISERVVSYSRGDEGTLLCMCVSSYGDIFSELSSGFRFIVIGEHAVFPIAEDRLLLHNLTHNLVFNQ